MELFGEVLGSRYPHIHIDRIISEFEDYLPLPGEMLGKRSSQIMISASRQLCIKLIDEETLAKMNEIFSEVIEFKDSCQMEDCLIDIYRVYQVESIKTNSNFKQTDLYILMPSVRTQFEHIMNVFDIKGFIDSPSGV